MFSPRRRVVSVPLYFDRKAELRANRPVRPALRLCPCEPGTAQTRAGRRRLQAARELGSAQRFPPSNSTPDRSSSAETFGYLQPLDADPQTHQRSVPDATEDFRAASASGRSKARNALLDRKRQARLSKRRAPLLHPCLLRLRVLLAWSQARATEPRDPCADSSLSRAKPRLPRPDEDD